MSYWYLRRQQLPPAAPPASPGALVSGGPSAAALASHPALRYGMPVGDRLRVFSDFVLEFDTRLRNPK